jgi:hypothetical protein
VIHGWEDLKQWYSLLSPRVIHVVQSSILVQNAKTEYLSSDVVEMYYPYNGILRRGFLNKFEAIIHQAYLCVKIPATQGVITIWGHQYDGRNLERGRTPGQRNVNALDEAVKGKNVEKQPKADKEKKSMCSQIVTPRKFCWMRWFGIKLSSLGQTSRRAKRWRKSNSSKRIEMCLPGLPRISQVWIETSLDTN